MTDDQPAINAPAVSKYDLGYKLLHWLMAVLIFLMFLAGQGFASATTDEETITMLIGHSSIGTIITMLLIVRITKRFVLKSPRPVHNLQSFQQKAARAVQLSLYGVMVLVPVSGYLTGRLHELPVTPFTLINISQSAANGYQETAYIAARVIHETSIKLLMVLLVLHISAALYHRFVLKDTVLASMTRGKTES